MSIQMYLNRTKLYRHLIDLTTLETIIKEQTQKFQAIQETIEADQNLEVDEQLFIYETPKFIGNSCSLDYGTVPYNLEKVLGEKHQKQAQYLRVLNAMVESVYQTTTVGWIGIYQKFQLPEGATLVKLAYRGLESRAEFPLYDSDFKSNNKTVGLTGKAIIINDINNYLETGGAYYECDATVQSEVCLPIFNADFSEIIGIVDAEDQRPYFFHGTRVLRIIALCFQLSTILK